MKANFSLARALAASALLAGAPALAQTASTADTNELLANRRLSPEVREEIRTRIDAVRARFQRSHGGLTPEQFGVQCCQITQIPAAMFSPLLPGGGWTFDGTGGYMSPVSGSSNLWAGVQLPSGAAIQYLGFYYYDNHPGADVQALLWAYSGGGPGSGAPSAVTLATAASEGTPGYGYDQETLNYTVDNLVAYVPTAAHLAVQVAVGGVGTNLQFKAAELWWMRQVSPAPSAATFGDVPTGHPQFQFVEALSASGITAGCGGGNYCPDNPLTRGQMAVFLAKALGLYWPQ